MHLVQILPAWVWRPDGRVVFTKQALFLFMQTYAAVDIGSNSCRLKIASVQRYRLKTLHEDREVTRLGESVFDTGVVSPDSMALTIRALKRFLKAIQLHAADQVRVVATSAVRDARNQSEFIAWVKSGTGW